mgnify:CR=1 FL=1
MSKTLDEQIGHLDVRLSKLYRRHRDVLRSIERVQSERMKLIRQKEKTSGPTHRLARPGSTELGA